MAKRCWPFGEGRQVYSGFGYRSGEYAGMHYGVDFGREGGSGGNPVYAAQAGTVVQTGAASGFGGPAPAGWIRVDHSDDEGGGHTIYGHIVGEVNVGDHVEAGQRIGHVNPNSATNGGVAPHLHFEVMPYGYSPGSQIDPLPWLAGAEEPGRGAPDSQSNMGVIFGVDVSKYQDGYSLAAAKNAGAEFVIIATGDGDISDPVYQSHYEDALTAGMVISAYHFLRAEREGSTIQAQVDASLRAMGDKKAPLWLDCETPGGVPLHEIQQAKQLFEQNGVRVLGVYCTANWWENMAGGEPPTAPLGAVWVANYGQDNAAPLHSLYGQVNHSVWDYPVGDQKPLLWQFGQRGIVAGELVDVNAYRGSLEQLREWWGGGKPQEGIMELHGVSAAALNDAKIAAQETLNEVKLKRPSRINPAREFTTGELAWFTDEKAWINHVLLVAVCQKLGLDPVAIVTDAIKAERGES